MNTFTRPLKVCALTDINAAVIYDYYYKSCSDFDDDDDALDIMWKRHIIKLNDNPNTILDIIQKNIDLGTFRVKRTSYENNKIILPVMYYLRAFNEIDVMIGIKKSVKHEASIMMISLDGTDIYAYYKYLFILAYMFNVKLNDM